jgi:hypothetical protein
MPCQCPFQMPSDIFVALWCAVYQMELCKALLEGLFLTDVPVLFGIPNTAIVVDPQLWAVSNENVYCRVKYSYWV